MNEPEMTPKEIRTAAWQQLAIRTGEHIFSEEEIEGIAYHEAGHAVVGMAFGFGIYLVALLPDDDFEAKTYTQLSKSGLTEENAPDCIKLFIAGSISERIMEGEEESLGALLSVCWPIRER